MRKRNQKRAQSLSREIHACFVVIYDGKGGWCFENNQVCAFVRYLSVEAAGCRIGNSGPWTKPLRGIGAFGWCGYLTKSVRILRF